MNNDEKIMAILADLPDNLDGVIHLSDIYSDLQKYDHNGALAGQVEETLKKIRQFSETKLSAFDKPVSANEAILYDSYLRISADNPELLPEQKERNDKVKTALVPYLEAYDQENNIADIDENTDINANAEAWEKATADITPIQEVKGEDGTVKYRTTKGFENLGGFFASIDKESCNDILESGRLEALQDLSQRQPSEDVEANRQSYIEKLNSVLTDISVQLHFEYQKQLFTAEHPEVLETKDFESDSKIEAKLQNPQTEITPADEEQIKAFEERISKGEELSLSEMATLCKSRPLLNKPARQALNKTLSQAGKAEKIEGEDLIALQFLLNETKRVHEYQGENEEDVASAQKHIDKFKQRMASTRAYMEVVSKKDISFKRDTFANRQVLKSSVANVIASRCVDAVWKAKRLANKTKAAQIWGKIKEWDQKNTQKHPRLYPMMRDVSISLTVGATFGVAGAIALSSYKLKKAVDKSRDDYRKQKEAAQAQGKEYPANFWKYLTAKENRRALLTLSTSATLTAVSAGFGVHNFVEHGLSAVTGLSGQVAQHGVSSLSAGGGNFVSGIVDKIQNFDIVEAGKSIIHNSRVLASTSISAASGIIGGQIAAVEQKQAERALDEFLKSHKAQLPTDKKIQKLRSSNPRAYVEQVLIAGNISLSEKEKQEITVLADKVEAKRKEKNSRRWGTFIGSSVGLTVAGFFGVKPEDVDSQTATNNVSADPHTDTSELGNQELPSTGPAHKSTEYFSGNDEQTIGEKLKGTDANATPTTEVENTEHSSTPDNSQNTEKTTSGHQTTENTETGNQAETAIDINSLSDRQKHDLDMLFKLYPRAATLILEGNHNPAFTDIPQHEVVSSSSLQHRFEANELSDTQLKDMLKFAHEHFDAKGNPIGPDAEYLKNELNHHSQAGHSHQSDTPKAENGQADQTEVQGNGEKQSPNNESATKPEANNSENGANKSDNEANNSEDGNGNTTDNTPQTHTISTKKGSITYSIEANDERGYQLSLSGDMTPDKALLKQMNHDIEYRNGEYFAANGRIHSANLNIVKGRVNALCGAITAENKIAEDLTARGGNLTTAEQAFLKSHQEHLSRFGITNDSPTATNNLEQTTAQEQPTQAEAKQTAQEQPAQTETKQTETKQQEQQTVQQTDTTNTVNGFQTGSNGFLKTQSGVEFKLENGDIIYKNTIETKVAEQTEAEIYKTISAQITSGAKVPDAQLRFANEYAAQNKLQMASAGVSAQSHTTAQQTTTQQTVAQSSTAQQASTNSHTTSGKQTTATQNQTASVKTKIKTQNDKYEDDIYYRPSKKTVAANVQGEKTTTTTSTTTTTNSETHTTTTTSHQKSQHTLIGSYYDSTALKGTYAIVDNGSGPILKAGNLTNVPSLTDVRCHINATLEWNANGSYNEYLGGAIRGNANQVQEQLSKYCNNLERSEAVYNDLLRRVSKKGYQLAEVEQKWMSGYEKQLESIGLSHNDKGKLVVVENAQSLKDKWYQTSSQVDRAKLLQCRGTAYQSRYNY